MTAQHTPGPWVALPEEVDKPYIRVRGTRLGGRYKIANVVTPVYEGVHEKEAEETRANARLIAAAPELLVALQEAENALADYIPTIERTGASLNYGHKMLRDVRAAIQKATNKEQV